MKRPDPLVEIEAGVRSDTAVALGRAGRTLRRAVEALVELDRHAAPRSRERKAVLHAATDALWAYVVQKEAIGVSDHAGASEIYGVTPEMWRLMGAAFQDESDNSPGRSPA